MKKMYVTIIAMMFIVSCSKDKVKTAVFTYKFDTNDEGWIAGYSDYPADLSAGDSLYLYEMSYGYSPLPEKIMPEQSGFRLRGHNRSDDLFMFIKKKITGLEPATSYNIRFKIELASNAPANAIGIGGAPGEGVTLKAGATSKEPVNMVVDGNWYQLNADKGNQTNGGTDAVVLGNIAVSDTTTAYTLITRENKSPLNAKTDINGDIWVFAGTDSGFEGLTEVYYTEIEIRFEKL